MNDLISRLSEIRSNYNCFDEKEGKRINFKIVSLRQLSKVLTNGLMNAIEGIVEIEMPKEE